MSDGLNPGRDLRVEAKEALLKVISSGNYQGSSSRGRSRAIMETLDSWIGGCDNLMHQLGQPLPIRPDSVFLGISDALEQLDPTKMGLTEILSILTASHTVKDRIPSYKGFVGRLEQHLQTTRPSEVEGLLMGLK